MELSKRLKRQKPKINHGNNTNHNSDSILSDQEEDATENQSSEGKPEEMMIDEVNTSPIENFLSKTRSQKHTDKSMKVINLLTAVVDML